MHPDAWKKFISGFGVEKLITAIEQIKRETQRIFRKGNRKRWLINSIRLEHLQIKKHHKLAMRYLQELEEMLAEIEVSELRRKHYRETYNITSKK